MLEAHKWRVGRGHERLDSLPASFLGSAAMNKKSIVDKTSIAAKKNHRCNLAMRALRSGGISTKDTTASLGRLGGGCCTSSPWSNVDSASHAIPHLPPLKDWSSTLASSAQLSRVDSPMLPHSSNLLFARAVDLLPVELQAVAPNQNPFALGYRRHRGLPRRKLTQQERAARLVTQRRQMERLASRPQDRLMNAYEKSKDMGSQGRRSFICSDGSTTLPYEIIGEPSLELTSHSFIVAHDLFDTLDASKIFFQAIADHNSGCQILVYNYAGQAGTSFSADRDDGGINVMLHARHLAELLHHVNLCGEMLLSTSPFFLVGIGYGLSICAELTHNIGIYHLTLRGLVSINGVPQVDTQYAAILHAALGAFEQFPADRPDLPISFLSRFQFSDAYLTRVHPNLALNIYTAVANPITLGGRLALLRGALDGAKNLSLSNIPLPVIALQSTEGVFVTPSNMEVVLRGRTVHHVWSYETGADKNCSCFGAHGRSLIRDSIGRVSGVSHRGCAIWVSAGHEVRQEATNIVLGVFAEIAPLAFEVESKQHADIRLFEQGTRCDIPHRQMEVFESSASNDGSIIPAKDIASEISNSTPRLFDKSASCISPLVSVDYHATINNNLQVVGTGTNTTSFDNIDSQDKEPLAGAVISTEIQVCEESLVMSNASETDSSFKRDATDVNVLPIAMQSNPIETIETPNCYEIHFSIVILDISPQELTKKVLRTLCGHIANRIERLGGGSVDLSVTLRAGSLILDVKASAELNKNTACALSSDISSRRQFLPEPWGTHTSFAVSVNRLPAIENAARQTEAPSPSQALSQEQSFISENPRCIGQYADFVDSAEDAISSAYTNPNPYETKHQLAALKEREFIEMQRQVEVDIAEAQLVEGGITPAYKTPPGVAAPIVHPPPTSYREHDISEIMNRNDPENMFASRTKPPNSNGVGTNLGASDREIKGELNSAQLVREFSIFKLISL